MSNQIITVWTNSMDDYLKQNYGYKPMNELKENLGIDENKIIKRALRLHLDRSASNKFSLEDLKGLSEIVQKPMGEIIGKFNDKTIESIYTNIEGLKNISKLPEKQETKLSGNGFPVYTTEEIEVLKNAILNKISPSKIKLPGRNKQSINNRYYSLKKIMNEGEKEASRIIKAKEENKKPLSDFKPQISINTQPIPQQKPFLEIVEPAKKYNSELSKVAELIKKQVNDIEGNENIFCSKTVQFKVLNFEIILNIQAVK